MTLDKSPLSSVEVCPFSLLPPSLSSEAAPILHELAASTERERNTQYIIMYVHIQWTILCVHTVEDLYKNTSELRTPL